MSTNLGDGTDESSDDELVYDALCGGLAVLLVVIIVMFFGCQ